jgi:hypothetical protein
MQEDFATKVEKLGECAAEIKGLEELQGVYYDFKMARSMERGRSSDRLFAQV